VALGLVLLIGAGLLIRSALMIRDVGPGFDAARTLTFKIALAGEKYEKTAAVAQFNRLLAGRLERTPGVLAAAGVINLPTEPGPDLSFTIEGRKQNAEGDEQWRLIGPRAFAATGVAVLGGRVFTERDGPDSAPVMIVNEAFAWKYWPKGSALGQRVRIGGVNPETAEPAREIVGVVASTREYGLDSAPPPIMYIPQPQMRDAWTMLAGRVLPAAWVVRTAANPLALERAVRAQVAQVDPQRAVFEFRSMEQVLGEALATQRFILLLLSTFAATALALASIGVYGVMSYTVEERTQEIGIRLALGAGGADVLRMVMWRGMSLCGVGLALGLAAAYGLTRLMASLLFEVKPTDPPTFASVALALAAVAALATWIPARRAMRVDPIVALRYQ
jgi:putative ABC transport system permease protein